MEQVLDIRDAPAAPKIPWRIVRVGWQALVEKLGYADATRFVMFLDKGHGDSVQYFRELWQDTTTEEMYHQIITNRQRPQIAIHPNPPTRESKHE